MKTSATTLLIFLWLFNSCPLFAQIQKPTTDSTRMRQIKNLINNVSKGKNGKSNYVTTYIFDSLKYEYQKILSGFQIKDGKLIGNSVSLEDNSATVNFFLFSFGNKKWFSHLNLSAESDEGLVDIFKKNSFQKTFSGGIKMQYYPKTTKGTYYTKNKNRLHNILFAHDFNFEKNKEIFKDRIYNNVEKLKALYSKAGWLKYAANDKRSQIDSNLFESLINYNQLLKELQIDDDDWYIMTDKIISDSSEFKIRQISKQDIADRMYKNEYLRIADSIQMSAEWNSLKVVWFDFYSGIGGKKYAVFDKNNSDDLFTTDKRDIFYDIQASVNVGKDLKKSNRKEFYSFALGINNSLQFDDDDLMEIRKDEWFITGNDSLHAFETTSFFPSVPERKVQIPLRFSYVWYNYVKKRGWEAGIEMENILKSFYSELHAGFFFPVITNDKTFIIEPLIRVKDFGKPHKVFFKEQFSLGINFSFSFPKFIGDPE